MNALERLEFCLRDDVVRDECTQVTLRVIVNPNPVVNNSQLPTGCKYCELRDEYNMGNELW